MWGAAAWMGLESSCFFRQLGLPKPPNHTAPGLWGRMTGYLGSFFQTRVRVRTPDPSGLRYVDTDALRLVRSAAGFDDMERVPAGLIEEDEVLVERGQAPTIGWRR